MGKPTLEFNQDHLLVRFGALDKVTAVTGDILVPFSTITSAEVAPPEWPSWTTVWGLGFRAPPFLLKGSVGRPLGPYDRFFWQDRGTSEVLRLRLAGHPRYREVALDVPDPAGALKRVEDGRKRVRA